MQRVLVREDLGGEGRGVAPPHCRTVRDSEQGQGCLGVLCQECRSLWRCSGGFTADWMMFPSFWTSAFAPLECNTARAWGGAG